MLEIVCKEPGIVAWEVLRDASSAAGEDEK